MPLRKLIPLFTILFLSAQVHGQSALMQAVIRSDSNEVMRILLDTTDIDLTEKHQGFQPLHYAARDNSIGSVRRLLEMGAPVDGKGSVKDQGEWTPLMLAVYNGNFEIAKMLLDSGAAWDWENESKISAITIANEKKDYWIDLLKKDKQSAWIQWLVNKSLSKNDAKELQNLIGEFGFDRVANRSFEWPLICFAARDNKQAIVEVLAKRPGQVDQKTPQGWTPLMLAVINNYTDICNILVRNGADLLIKDSSGKTAITWAKELKLTHLLEIFADPDKGMATYQRNLRLFRAIELKDLDLVKMALDQGADIESIGPSNFTPLATALTRAGADIAGFLLARGADPEKEYGHYQQRTTAVFHAAKNGANEFLMALARAGVDISRTDKSGKSSKDIALENKRWWTSKIIADTSAYHVQKAFTSIEKGSEPGNTLRAYLTRDRSLLNFTDEKGNTLLHNAVLNKSADWLEFLLRSGADQTLTNADEETAKEIAEDKEYYHFELYFEDLDKAVRYHQLFRSIEKKQTKDISQQLRGLDINFRNVEGLNALHLAIRSSQDTLVQLLLKAGADPDRITGEGKTPLALAAINNDYLAVLALEAAGADIDTADLAGTESYWIKNHFAAPAEIKKQFYLHHEMSKAAGRGDSAAVVKYLALGVNPDLHGRGGMNPLHIAAEAGHLSIVKLLVSNGANLTLQSLGKLETPKMLAARNKRYEVVRYLGFDKDDLFQKDWQGTTLFDLVDNDAELLKVRSRLTRDAYLFMLAIDGDIEEFKASENEIADINVRDRENETFLIKAVRSGSFETVEWLLKKGADPTIYSGDASECALAIAAAAGDFKISYLLLTDKTGKPCVAAAAKAAKENGFSEIARWLEGNKRSLASLQLLEAVIGQDTALVFKALAAKADPNVREGDSTSFTPLHFASRESKPELVAALLRAGADPNLKAYAGDHLYTPLMLAAYNDRFTCADLLLQYGADPNWKNDVDTSARDIALERSPFITKLFINKTAAREEYRGNKLVFDLIAKRNVPALRQALEEKIPIDRPDAANLLPIHRAVQRRSLEMTKMLLEKNADINSVAGGLTPLSIALLNGDLSMTTFLVENKADVKRKLENDSTVIQMAEARGLDEFVTVLNGNTASVRDYEEWMQSVVSNDTATFFKKLKMGLDAGKKMKQGYTMLHYAARGGADEIVKALIGASADVDLLTDDRWSPLMLAANNGHWKTAYLLLNNGANKKLENKDFNDASELAVKKGYKQVKQLLDSPETVYNQLMLIDAVTNKRTSDVELLLRKNIDINYTTTDDWTALHYAVRENLKDITTILLRRGADLTAVAITTEGPFTPLMLAATNNFPEMVKLLLDAGADPLRSVGDETAMSISIKSRAYWCEQIMKNAESGYRRYLSSLQLRKGIINDDLAEIQEAVFNGASRDEMFDDGLFPLHLAVRENRKAAIGYLLRNDPDIEKVTKWGSTALMITAVNGLHSIAAELIRRGADPSRKDPSGFTALDMARKNGFPEFENLFRSPEKFLMQQDLVEAVKRKDIATVASLIKKGVDVNTPLSKENPLIIAVTSSHPEITELLLKAKADPELRNEKSEKPVLISIRFDSGTHRMKEFDLAPFKIFHLLLSHGAKTSAVDSLNRTIQYHLKMHPVKWYAERLVNEAAFKKVLDTEKLLAAVKAGDKQRLISLLKQGNKGMPDAYGNSLVSFAIYNEPAMASSLINNNVVAGLFPTAAMEAAVKTRSLELIKLLKQSGAGIDDFISDGNTPLTYSLKEGNTKVVKALLALGADPNKRSESGELPLEIPARSYYAQESVKLLLDAGADPNQRSFYNSMYPIQHAKDSAVTSMLIAHGAKVNVSSDYGWTPLHEAVKNGSRSVVQMLMKAGAELNKIGLDEGKERTPFMVAVDADYLSLAVLLTEAGADPYVRTASGESAYSIAQQQKNQRMLRLLIDPAKNKYDHYFAEAMEAGDTTLALQMLRKGADINHQDRSGYTVLHDRILYMNEQRLPGVLFLLNQGARFDIYTKEGKTAFDQVIDKKVSWMQEKVHYDTVIERMLQKGYDVNRQNDQRVTALELAVQGNDLKLVKRLLLAGARTDVRNVSGQTVYDIAAANGNARMKEVLDGTFDPRGVLTFKELYADFKSRPVDNKGNLDDMLQAEQTMEAVLRERKRGSEDHMNVLNDYVYILSYNNRLSEALAAAEEYTNLATEAGSKSFEVRDMFRVQELLYSNSGNTKKAIEAVKKALEQITTDGSERRDTYRSLAGLYTDSLATHYYLLALGQLDKAYYDTVDANELRADYATHLVGQKDPKGIEMLRTLEKDIRDTSIHSTLARNIYPEIIEYELKAGNKKAALDYYKKFTSRKDIQSHAYTAARVALKLGEEKDAEKFLKEAKKIKINALSAEYVFLQHLLKKDDTVRVIASLRTYNQDLLAQLKKEFRYLSEEEKYSLLSNKQQYFDIIHTAAARYPDRQELVSMSLNIALFQKGALMRSTSALKAVVDTTSAGVKELYARWKQVKSELEGQYTLAPDKRTLDVPFLEEKLRQYEKALFSYSNVEDSVSTWSEVQRKLASGDVAVEFVSYQVFTDEWKDSTRLMAIVLPREGMPVLINLCSENELLNEIKKPESEKDLSYVNRIYMRGSESHRLGITTSLNLYQMIFQPLEPQVKNANRMYLSLSGSLHKISLAALPVSDDSLFIDKYNFHYVSSIASLPGAEDAKSSNRTISLFGGINYERGVAKQGVKEEGGKLVDRSIDLGRNVNGDWKYLPGTKTETEMIYSLGKKYGWKPVIDSGMRATESRVKALNGGSTSIIHIATHGYFFPKSEKKNTEEELTSAFTTGENPLFRTGLMLAGANTTWKNGFTESGKEDGILTGYEVSNLDLNSAELVVLSACETGLGDIKGSEGVYGLQRAFKTAGAKKLIMSLWQVPDKETAELMENFYSNLFSGMDYHAAFEKAQKHMRSKYPPYFWAAFVMVE